MRYSGDLGEGNQFECCVGSKETEEAPEVIGFSSRILLKTILYIVITYSAKYSASKRWDIPKA